ncbi:hypothetical protein [Streptodolium elevatio]|uniref:HEAT repeat domain-containing protein n=1 Tax=Streptodolium elevatio TaxID=3157996 RepID=A0ABV3DGL3_9ACTN
MTTFSGQRWDGPLARAAIEDVDWASLTHAYGAADDVPDRIAALRSPDRSTRDQAYAALYGSVFHQGTRYAASPFAARALISLAADTATPQRHRVLTLLASLAIGYDDACLPGGFDPARLRREVAEAAALDPADARREMEEWVAEAPSEDIRRNRAYHLEVFDFAFERDCLRWALESYDAVRTGTAVYRALLEDDEPGVRIAAAYLLAWFPEDAERSVPALVEVLRTEAHGHVVATAAVAVLLLGGDAALTAWAERGMSDTGEPVAWAAAFVLACLGGGSARAEAVAVLQAHIAQDADGPEDDGPVPDDDETAAPDDEAAVSVPYLGGDLAGLAMAALELLGVDGGDAYA